jgi:formylglycine-generating enzyme required for sulfatase activity
MRDITMDYPQNEISVEPIICYPRRAEPGKTYLMTVDLKPVFQGAIWPYSEEEYVVHCHVNGGSLFEVQQKGETDIVVHRFGGTYGPATFLLTAASEEQIGHIDITLINSWSVPIDVIELSGIQVTARDEWFAPANPAKGWTIDRPKVPQRNVPSPFDREMSGALSGKVRFARLINERLAILDRSAVWLARKLGTNESNISRWRDNTVPTMPRNPARVRDLASALEMDEAQERDLFDAAGIVFQAPKEQTSSLARRNREHVAAYLEAVRTQCGQVETRPYRQLSEIRGAPARFSLWGGNGRARIYIPLRFDVQPRRSDLWGDPWGEAGVDDKSKRKRMTRERARTDIDLAGVLEEPGHVVFVGAAGSGKTTVLRLVADVLARENTALARQQLGLVANPLPLPIFIALRDFEHACRTAPENYHRDMDSLLRFLDDHFARWHPGRVPADFLSGLVRAGRAWLLLDALDEVVDFDHRIAVRQVIEKLIDAFPGNRLLVTARVAAYARANTRLDERFQVTTVRDLTREQWMPMAESLYSGLEADADIAAERARRLIARIDATPQLQEMVKTPLMVWTATLINHADRELPDQRAELYRAYVDVLLGERLHEESRTEGAQLLSDERWSMDDRLLYLTYAAYQAHEAEQKRQRGSQSFDALVVVDEQELVKHILAPFMVKNMMLSGDRHQVEHQAEREAREFVAFMAERSGLLIAHAEGYSFGDHVTMQEYLVASYLVDDVRGSVGWLDFLTGRAGQSWWQEVFLLMAGYLLRRSEQARRFVLEELGALPGDGDAHAYGLAWAGRALLEIPPRRVAWHESARAELAGRLVRVLWQNPPATSVAARVEVGEVLGRLGDPRFSGPYLLPEFIPIAGGIFWMGSDDAEDARVEAETGKERKDAWPRHEVELDSFALARYPTTNAMFRRFMEAGGYADARWWPEEKASGVWQPDGTVKDRRGDGRSQPANWDDARFNNPSQPVVGVTWYEGAAYCRWLTDALSDGYVYRLPTEAEWERAARGREGWRYPWGDTWAETWCNSKELDLGRTTPVGIFPQDASAEGVMDLSGNVCEWCSDWYGEQTYRRRTGRPVRNPTGPVFGQSRVLRGGSWITPQDAVRCASRSRNFPDVRITDCGFRMAREQLINLPSSSELAKLKTLSRNYDHAEKIKSAWENDPFIPIESAASYRKAIEEFDRASNELDSFHSLMKSRYPDYDFKL